MHYKHYRCPVKFGDDGSGDDDGGGRGCGGGGKYGTPGAGVIIYLAPEIGPADTAGRFNGRTMLELTKTKTKHQLGDFFFHFSSSRRRRPRPPRKERALHGKKRRKKKVRISEEGAREKETERKDRMRRKENKKRKGKNEKKEERERRETKRKGRGERKRGIGDLSRVSLVTEFLGLGAPRKLRHLPPPSSDPLAPR